MAEYRNVEAPDEPAGGINDDIDGPEGPATPDAPDGMDSGGRSGITDMMMNTEPSPPLESVESPWNPEDGGPTRIFRGVQKAFGASGMPAIADLLIGMAETYLAATADTGDELDGEELTIQGEP